jgi:hypothetical protein
MKSSKLHTIARAERRELIMEKRKMTITIHKQRGRSYVQSRTTLFDKHSSDRQRARYGRQLTAGQIRLAAVTPPAPAVKPKAKRTRKIAG